MDQIINPSQPNLDQTEQAAKKQRLHPFIHKTIWVMGLRVAALILALALNVVLARALGPASYGQFAYGMSVANVIGVLGLFGLDRLLVRNLATYAAQADWAHLRGFARWAGLITVILLTVVITIALIFWLAMTPSLSPLWQTSLIAVIAVTPTLVIVRLAQSMLQGLQYPVASQILDIAWQVMAIALIGSAPYWATSTQLNAEMAVWMRGVAQVCAVFIAGMFIYRILTRSITPAVPRYLSRIWLRSALHLVAAGVLTMLYSQLDILMLGWLTDATQVSIYATASKGALLVGLVLPSANLVLAPRFTGLLVNGELVRLQHLVTRSARLILLATTPLCLGMIFAGHWFLSVFGPSFVQGHLTLIILSIGQWLSVAMGSVSLLLMLSGYERDVVMGLAASVLASIAGNLVLIPIWGIEGAAVATTASIIVWNAVLYLFVRRRLGLAPSVLGGPQRQGEFISQVNHANDID